MQNKSTIPIRGLNLIELIRDYCRLEAEVKALASILECVESRGGLPKGGWRATLEKMRRTPEYRSVSEQYEPLLLRAERSADLAEAVAASTLVC
jgi:hypothetical protein